MSSTEPQRLETLTDTQRERLQTYHSEWLERANASKRPSDLEFEQFLDLIYEVLKCPKPKVFWCDSPWQLLVLPSLIETLARTRLKYREEMGESLNLPLWKKAWARLTEQLDESTSERLRNSEANFSFGGESSGMGALMNTKLLIELESCISSSFPIHPGPNLTDVRAILRKRAEFNRNESAHANQVMQEVISSTTLGNRFTQLVDIPGPITTLHNGVAGLVRSIGTIFSPNTFRSVAPADVSLEEVFEALGSLSFSAKEIFRRATEGFSPTGLEAEFESQIGAHLANNIWKEVNDSPSADRAQMLQLFMAMHIFSWAPATMFQLGGDGFIPYFSFLLEVAGPQEASPVVTMVRDWPRFAAHCFPALCFRNMIFVCSAPTYVSTDDRGRLHSDEGHAVVYKDGFSLYSWHGTTVPEIVIKDPQSITINVIEKEQNAEARRVMIERYGLRSFIRDSEAKIVSADQYGVLYRKHIPGDELLVMVELKNSTPEPDGSFKTYFLRVPPNTRTAKEAVAWTFGVNTEDYSPELET